MIGIDLADVWMRDAGLRRTGMRRLGVRSMGMRGIGGCGGRQHTQRRRAFRCSAPRRMPHRNI